ncbi:hypothetical protein [Duncaniella dubosii]|uniref:hypothetical protein n=1 Tax=Duncaniella dubosii TaxID=2518971 RepID=UPI000F51A900|nr:hypothetical protein [Duncaniella dubosii]MCX4285035.1 hypothetical protein [Duncaniella dubosii]ROS83736.1 hypothetical protein EEK90_06935 [Muribaculaceae bacterium Isolate-036 (Harlan)]
MFTYEITVKERNGHILHPSYSSPNEVSRSFLIDFFGLNEPDVESYSIKKVEPSSNKNHE